MLGRLVRIDMHPHSFSRQSKFQFVMFSILYVATGFLFAVIVSTSSIPVGLGVGLVVTVAFFYMIPLVQDSVAKDRAEQPYVRCEGCGWLKSESEVVDWNGHTLCPLCDRDEPHQKEYAVNHPMWMKRRTKV